MVIFSAVPLVVVADLRRRRSTRTKGSNLRISKIDAEEVAMVEKRKVKQKFKRQVYLIRLVYL
jgi:hypothetical protein